MVALRDGQPRVLNLKEMLHGVPRAPARGVTRRTLYDLREARKKAHIQEGLAVALSNVDGDHRADQEIADAGRGEGRLDGQVLALDRGRRDAQARRRGRLAPRDGLEKAMSPSQERLQPVDAQAQAIPSRCGFSA